MKAFWTFALLVLTLTQLMAQEKRAVIYFEPFDYATNQYLNAQTVNSPTANRWTVNSVYPGKGGIETVPAQPTDVIRENRGYLHIVSAQDTNGNAHFDPKVASEALLIIGEKICTYGMVNGELSFSWFGNGNKNAYVQLLYSLNGDPWIPLIPDTLRNSGGVWKRETIALKNFVDKAYLRFAIRWRNDAGTEAPKLSFGIDDIKVLGLPKTNLRFSISNIEKFPYFPQMTNDTIWVKGKVYPLNPDTIGADKPRRKGDTLVICKNQSFKVQLLHSAPMCDGEYKLNLVDESVLESVSFSLQQTFGAQTITATLPCGLRDGFYKLVAKRQSNYYPTYLSSDTIGYIKVRSCADSIYNVNLVTVPQEDTTRSLINRGNFNETRNPIRSICTGSWFSVYFNSRGCYNPGNDYWLELSNENGHFDDEDGNFIGQVLSKKRLNAYSYQNYSNPGYFLVKMPDQKDFFEPDHFKPLPSCNYRIRMRSTEQPSLSEVFPYCDTTHDQNGNITSITSATFCIKDCSIETNKTEPLNICVANPDVPTEIKIPYWAFRFDRNVTYNDLNKFEWELWTYNIFNTRLVHRGKFGSYNLKDNEIKLRGGIPPIFPNAYDSLSLVIPRLDSLISWGSPPESYFIRIVATGAELNEGFREFKDSTGTVIPLQIGVPANKPVTLVNLNPGQLYRFCGNDESETFNILVKDVNFDKRSRYAWYFFTYDFPPNYEQMTDQEKAEWESHLPDSIQAWQDSINMYATGFNGSFERFFRWRGQILPAGVNPSRYTDNTGLGLWRYSLSAFPKAKYTIIFTQEVCGADTCRNPVSNGLVIPIIRANCVPVEVDAGKGDTICTRQSATVGTPIADRRGLKFNWSPPQTLDNPNDPTTTAYPEGTTVYTLTVTDEFLYEPNQASDTVRVILLKASLQANPQTLILSQGNTVQFNATGEGAVRADWDFGNGKTSVDRNPAPVTYDQPGTYTVKVKLYAPNDCFSEATTTVRVLMYPDSRPEDYLPTVSLYPNPANDYLEIHLSQAGTYAYTVSNALGQIVLSDQVFTENNAFTTDISSLTGGIYTLHLTTPSGQKLHAKWIKQ